MKNQKGSVLLVLILTLSVISLYFINYWQTITLCQELVIKKYGYEKQFRATEALCNFGVYTVINNYEQIQKNSNGSELIIFKGHWPPNQGTFNALLKLKKQDPEIIIEALTIEAKLNPNTLVIKTNLSRELILDQNKKPLQKFMVTRWRINEE